MSFKTPLILALAAVFSVSCGEKTAPENPVTISIISDRAVSVPAGGASIRVTYRIEGSSSPVSATADAPWMDILAVGAETVDVRIPENGTGSSRLGRLILSCPGAANQSVVVSQPAKRGDVFPRGCFEITVGAISCDKAEVSIIPDDYSVSYSWGVISRKEYLAMGREAFVRNRIEMMEGLSALYGRPFSELLQTGPLKESASNLFDDTEYYIVAFVLDERKVVPEEVSIVPFRSMKARQSEMKISLSVIGSQMLVSPSLDGTYICDCTLKSTFDSYDDPMDIAREYVSTLRTYGYLESYIYSGQHSENLNSTLSDGLIPGMRYVCYAVGYTSNPSAGPGFTTRMFTMEFTYASK